MDIINFETKFNLLEIIYVSKLTKSWAWFMYILME